MTRLQRLLLKQADAQDAQKAFFDKYPPDAADVPEDEIKAVEARNVELETLKADIEREEKLEVMREQSAKSAENTESVKGIPPAPSVSDEKETSVKALATSQRHGELKHFPGKDGDVRALKFGHFALAALFDSPKSKKFMADYGVGGEEYKSQVESSNSRGGFLVPSELAQDIIDIRQSYGVFEMNAAVRKMNRDQMDVLRDEEEVEAYFTEELEASTKVVKDYGMISLVAKKVAAVAVISSELSEDAIIDVGNQLAGSIGKAFAKKVDKCGFFGDGTSPYGGMQGLIPKLLAIAAANGSFSTGLIQASGNLWSEVTLADILKLFGAIPERAEMDESQLAWYCNRRFYSEVLLNLAMEAGGATAAEFVAGIAGGTKRFMGYRVVTSPLFPKAAANSGVPLMFGNLQKSSIFGDRRQFTISQSSEYKWLEDGLAIKGTQRFDINNHDLGKVSTDGTDFEIGSMVGLQLAAS
jgi:HK97 family phage major capsid protein